MTNSNHIYQLIWMSRPLMQAAETIVEQGLVGTGLTVRMRAVLEIIMKHGQLSVPNIAQHLHIQRQYVQVMINETHTAGLTDKTPNPRHKSSPLICLTDTGQDMIECVLRREREILADISVDFDEAKIQVALDVAESLLVKLTAHSQGVKP